MCAAEERPAGIVLEQDLIWRTTARPRYCKAFRSDNRADSGREIGQLSQLPALEGLPSAVLAFI